MAKQEVSFESIRADVRARRFSPLYVLMGEEPFFIDQITELLMNTDLPIAEVADRLGYSSVCHFNAMFKKNVGLPPGKFRQSFHKEEE